MSQLPQDTFRGDNAALIASITALLDLDLDKEGALVPHGVGGHARALLESAAARLAPAIDPEDESLSLFGLISSYGAASHGAGIAYGMDVPSAEQEQRRNSLLVEIERRLRAEANVKQSFEQECRDIDNLLDHLGLDPEAMRTEGGPLNLPRIKEALKPRLLTPSAQWRVDGESDPHEGRYDVERAQLCMGHLTDDELANGAFMKYDRPLNVNGILAGTHFSPIAWMTAVKDRIRWLSRSLEKATAAKEAK